MTDYNAIANADIDQDSPITDTLLQSLRDNPIAMMEGASGAPRLYGDAVATNDELPVLTVTAADTYNVGAGLNTVQTASSGNSLTYETFYTLTVVAVTGTIRIGGQQFSSGGFVFTTTIKVAKNGTTVVEWTNNETTGPVTRSVDISVVPDDVITIEGKTADTRESANFTSVTRTASNGYTARTPYGREDET